MEEKYYTPEISEFHVGFEYERKNGEIWEKDAIMMNDDFYSSGDEYENEFEEIDKGIRDVRVKFLDKEDIESLGFEYIDNEGIEQNYGYLFSKPSKNYSQGKVELRFWYNSNRVCIDDTGIILFNSTIKNKSELKKILKMVGILE